MKKENKLNIVLKKPLAFIKVQTTGLNYETDRIIEFSITKIMTDGTVQSGTRRFNPGISIPKEATEFNGIVDEMVKESPTFQDVAKKVNDFLGDCDFAGFNIRNFDLKFLSEEFNKANIEFTIYGRNIIDLTSIYHSMEPRDFRSAAKFYCDQIIPYGTVLTSEFVNVTNINVLEKMLQKYESAKYQDKKGGLHDFQNNIEILNELFNDNKKALDIDGCIILNEDGKPILNIGQKYKGQLISVIANDTNYCDWFLKDSKMAADTKLIFKKIIAKATASVK